MSDEHALKAGHKVRHLAALHTLSQGFKIALPLVNALNR